MGFTWIEPQRGRALVGRNGRRGIAIAVRDSHRDGQTRPQIVLSFSTPLMRALRWQCGDRIVVGLNENAIGIKRVNQSGYSLSPVGSSKAARQEAIGRSVSAVCKVALPADWPLKVGDTLVCEEPDVSAEGVVIVKL